MPTNRSLAAVVLLVAGFALLLPVVITGLGTAPWTGTGPVGPMDGSMSGPMAGGGHAGGMGWGGGLVGWSLGLLGLLAVVGAGLLLWESDGGRDDSALSELRSAYARGDLRDEEFERRRSRLQEGDADER